MNFASYEFWKLLVLCFLGSRLVMAACRTFLPSAEPGLAKSCLLVTALVLLGSESTLTLACFLWVILLGWAALLLHGNSWNEHIKRVLFLLLLIAQLGPLFYYKYWNFLFNEVLGFDVRIPSVLIPMGLSFYTFQTIGFWVDQKRNPQPLPRFIDYLNFSSFFPQIVAGPIEKRENLLPQIETTSFRIHRQNIDSALRWIVLGLAYKLIVADNLGGLADKLSVDAFNAYHIWTECLIFGIRIYFDFSGYSFIAVGLGLLFGVHLSLNFRSPYLATDLRQFWRDWHVTLGAWLRDYIYLPLGGKRVSWWMLNTLVVFIVSGIWHGAGWGFLIWGLLHGMGVVVASHQGTWLKFKPLQWASTFVFVNFTWLFFLERDPATLWNKSLSLFQPSAYSLSDIKAISGIFAGPVDLITTGLILAIAVVAISLEGLDKLNGHEPYHFGRSTVSCVVLVILTVLLAPLQESSFIYFNF